MTVEEIIRALSGTEFYNQVVIIKDGERYEDFEICIDNSDVYIEVK